MTSPRTAGRQEAAAVDLAARGYYPFPCKLDKDPLTTHGYQDATRDERQLLQWWDRHPTASVGIACGASGIGALDIDSKAGADPRIILPQLGIDPDSPNVVWTGVAGAPTAKHPHSLEGVRGCHVYFRGFMAKRATTAIAGVGLWGDGAYLIAPPSPHPSGVQYEGELPAVRALPEIPPRVLEALGPAPVSASIAPADDEDLIEGERHEQLLNWGISRLTARGVLDQVALDAMHGHNQRYCRPPLDSAEVVRLWKHLQKTRIAQSERRLAVAPTSLDDIHGVKTGKLAVLNTLQLVTTAPPSIDWLADGIFCKGKMALIGGREKSGKSLVQLATAITIASGGGGIAGITVKPGKVLICDGENGEEEIHRRLHSLGLDRAHAGQLVLAEARAFDLREDLHEIEALIDVHQPDLVLLDSFRALWRGSERDEEEIASALYPVAELAHRRRVAIGLTHHATKGDSGDYRGSTAIGAVPDWVCVLARDREDGDQMRRRLTTPYTRFAPPRADRWLRICSDGDDGRVWLETCDAFVPEPDAPVRDEIERSLRELIDGGVWGVVPLKGTTPPHPPDLQGNSGGGENGATPPSWSTADFARGVGRAPRDWTVRQAVQRLADAGVIHRNGDGNRWHRTEALFDDEEGGS